MSTLEAIRAIADESRARIIQLLSLGAFNVQELTGVLEISQSTISHHLKILQGAGVIRTRKEGTWSYHALVTDASEGALAQSLVAKIAAETGAPYPSDLRAGKELLNRRRDRTKIFFDTIAGSWHELRKEAHGNISFLDELAEHIPPQASVLELGCGSGALLEKILPRPGVTIGVDSSLSMLEEARKTLGSRASGADLRLGYLEHLPVGDESVDVAVAYMVFHHVADLERALSDTLRALKPGSEFIVIERANYDKKAMRERFGELWFDFNAKDFIETVTAVGFGSVKTRQLGSADEAFWLTAKKDFLQSKSEEK